MLRDAKDIVNNLRELQRRHAPRDARWDDVRAARNGDLSSVAPDLFNDDWSKPIVANFIDTVARDLAEMGAPLPSFNCSSATMQSDTARKFADKRTKILQNYIRQSKLERQMLSGADHFLTYAACILYIEPDFEEKIPRICVEDPVGGYADFDRWNRLRAYHKRWYCDAAVLADMFPEFSQAIYDTSRNGMPGGPSSMVEVIRYCDPQQLSLVLISKEPRLLVSSPNPLGETPVVVIRRPWLHDDAYKGQFDDAIWVQVARNALAVLNLEAVQKSVQSPIALPSDVQEFALGPDSIIRTATPEKAGRIKLEVPQGAFAESQLLMEEMRTGTRYPAARSGGVDANIITGRGVQALLGGFETQIRAMQSCLKDGFMEMDRICFKMDEVYWPNTSKTIRGQANGSPYEITYKPSKDIAGDHTSEVEYGFAAGMDPNRAVVMLLQLRGDKLISRDYFQRQLPFDLNVGEEQSKVDVEEMREAIKQGIAGYVQAIPALAQQGMDPSDPITKAAMLVKSIQKGDAIEDVVMAVFAPPKPPQQGAPGMPPGVDQLAGAGGPGPQPGPGGGLTASGRLEGVPAGQAGQAPGGRPDLSVMLAGLTGQGAPQMSSYVMKRRRI